MPKVFAKTITNNEQERRALDESSVVDDITLRRVMSDVPLLNLVLTKLKFTKNLDQLVMQADGKRRSSTRANLRRFMAHSYGGWHR